ncbi:MAG: hypothetical protein ACTMIS_24095 [Pseudomonas putida]|nr:hypothetical protein [Pseudomonas putida]MDD2118916.1 hypothetical protein [Pseudomonas putida]WQE55617.1 hypothetical protein U0028_08090 [Pseudomonas putida]
MKKTLITLAVGLGLASNALAANTGSIHFHGHVQPLPPDDQANA